MNANKELNQLRSTILVMAQKSKEGHIPSSLSILDIVWVLYTRVLNVDPKNPLLSGRDRFFLSKGHASLALYVVLAKTGFFSENELEHFAEYKSILGGHPDRLKVPGLEASTGSLGHGFPQAVGTALSLKVRGASPRVFVLIGDGESNEGTIWESALLASQYQLSNLVCILDLNHSSDRALKMGNMSAKFESFGWIVREINGHDHHEIELAMKNISSSQPLFIIANTIKGKGIEVMESNPEWHHKIPSISEVAKFLDDLT